MSNKRSDKPVLKPMTIRFSTEAWAAIEDMAEKNNTNKTDIVRSAVVRNLAHYYGNIRIVEKGQAEEIKKLITALFDTTAKIEMELHRIGVNYNQEIKLKQIERKYAGRGNDFASIMAQGKEREEALKDSSSFSKDEIDALITRYEDATAKVGEILCRILT